METFPINNTWGIKNIVLPYCSIVVQDDESNSLKENPSQCISKFYLFSKRQFHRTQRKCYSGLCKTTSEAWDASHLIQSCTHPLQTIDRYIV